MAACGAGRGVTIASMAGYAGGNNVELRYQNLTATGVELKSEEDTTLDTEQNHTGEPVHYLVLAGAGTLMATPN